jgi:endonuclease/exonuclease/phosphatase family metal-dependent hydrolase
LYISIMSIIKRRSIALQFFFFTLLFFSCQQKPPRLGMPKHFSGTIPDTITIASYNVENLFDMVDNGDEYPEYKPNKCNWTNNTFQIKCSNIASVLAQINADIAVLVEVENENALSGLRAALAEKNCPYPFYALGGAANKGSVMPVVLSKFPILGEKTFEVSEAGSTHDRNMLEAAVYLGRDTLTVFACHWPSKTHKESARITNARLLASRLKEIPRGKDYVVAGDFNEDWDECESFHTTGLDDTKGVTGVNHVLGTVSSQPGTFVAYHKKSGRVSDSAVALFDPWLEVPEVRRFTTVYKGRCETPDHILLPPSMFDSAGISYVDNSFSPFTWNGRLMKDGAPYRWQMRFAKGGRFHVGDGYSDHLPILARLCRRPYTQRELPDTSDADESVTRSVGNGGGFEDGADGWVSCVKGVRVSRDTVAPHTGAYCLAISGRAGQNATSARCRMIAPPSCGPGGCTLRLWLRGEGSMCFRTKVADAGRWTYFRGEEFTPAKAGKYTDYAFKRWTAISLPLAPAPESQKEFDVEIRAKKDKEVKLFVDDMRIDCNN